MAQVRGSVGKGGSVLKAAVVAARGTALLVQRSERITSEYVDKVCKVHNGRAYVLVRPTNEMVVMGMKFGEYAKTRWYRLPVKKVVKKVKK